MNHKNVLLSVILSVLPLFLTGCLFGGHSDTKREGPEISVNTLEQIEPGKTTAAWVRAVIGAPTETVDVDPHEQIWKYVSTETKNSHGYVIFIFEAGDKKVLQTTVFIQIRDGIVIKTWRD